MKPEQKIWWEWASLLRQIGIVELSISVLEIGSPLTLIAAQLIYLCQPVLRLFMPSNDSQVLAEMLEQPVLTREFIQILKEDFR
jgi:hypothetical protein